MNEKTETKDHRIIYFVTYRQPTWQAW